MRLGRHDEVDEQVEEEAEEDAFTSVFTSNIVSRDALSDTVGRCRLNRPDMSELSPRNLYFLKDCDAGGLRDIWSAGSLLLTDLIGQTHFDTTTSIQDQNTEFNKTCDVWF